MDRKYGSLQSGLRNGYSPESSRKKPVLSSQHFRRKSLHSPCAKSLPARIRAVQGAGESCVEGFREVSGFYGGFRGVDLGGLGGSFKGFWGV